MRNFILGIFFGVYCGLFSTASAQQSVWVQIEAHRTLDEAQTRAQTYAGSLQRVSGYTLRSGWHAVALGPFTPTDATVVLQQLRVTRQIPGDSYIVDGGQFNGQFWPDGQIFETALPTVPEPSPEIVEIVPLIPAEETVAEARQSERYLTREERQLIQTALQWEGFYTSAIDGAFGPGTRNSMAAWQQQENYEDTGVLTTKQRNLLVSRYQEMLASLGMTPIIENEAGIEIDIPGALVALDRYEPPFVHFDPRGDSGVRVLLISQTGDIATLGGLFDIMQTLEIVPLEGPRQMGRNSFSLIGENDRISSYTFAALNDGQVKGFTLVWPSGPDKRRQLVIDQMRASFRPFSDAVLPDIYGDPSAAQSVDLLAGLAIRQPDVSRTGFYVDGSGAVLTTAEAVGSCERITLDETYAAEVVAIDDASGLALLRPSDGLEPIDFARLLPGVPRINSEVAVSGYSYEGLLGAPTLTYGTLEDIKGLKGEPTLKRLALLATDSDAGGPVFDSNGSVLGMLLPNEQDGGRRLPEGVSFAADTTAIVEFLSANGVSAAASDLTGAVAPEDLTLRAADMTVLVSCWN